MEDQGRTNKKKKTAIVITAVSSITVVLFLCIFSLYHLPERDPVETPEMVENPNYVESPAGDFEETDDIMSASREEVGQMLGDLEMQYQNARLNNEPYAAQQAGLRLALAYWKASETTQAKECVQSLIENYGYDENFMTKCQELLKKIDTPAN